MAVKVAALAGGVGGAKLADGLAMVLPDDELTVIVNTGDDFEHLGLSICPDLDTVLYTLGKVANPETGWGRMHESWQVMDELEVLRGQTWFRLGDKDLALHLYRTGRLSEGASLSEVMRELSQALKVGVTILPMTDDRVATIVETEQGAFPFQEYFVAMRWQPIVTGFRFAGAREASPAPGVLEAIDGADFVVLCPSNPWVSIDPILAVPGIRPALRSKAVFAVSPVIGGEALKGPAAKMFKELEQDPSVTAVARHYADFLTGLIIDGRDEQYMEEIRDLGIEPSASDIVMRDREERKGLAEVVLGRARDHQSRTVGL